MHQTLHVGDFGFFPKSIWWPSYLDTVQSAADRYGISVDITPGNHEHWGILRDQFREHDGPYQLAPNLRVLPPGHREMIGGRSFIGGATSVDRQFRLEGVDWWVDEAIRDKDVDNVRAQEPADVLITHDAPLTCTVEVALQRQQSPSWIPESDFQLSLECGGRRSGAGRYHLQPSLHFHGHWHLPGSQTFDDGRTVVSLGMDGQRLNLARVELDTLHWSEVVVGDADTAH